MNAFGKQNVAFGIGAVVFLGGVAFNRYAARRLRKNKEIVAEYDRWIDAIQKLDSTSPTYKDDIAFWRIIVDNEGVF